MQRINKRKRKNRYDKFPKKFYVKVQNSFINIAKKNKDRCLILDNSEDSNFIELEILKKVLFRIRK